LKDKKIAIKKIGTSFEKKIEDKLKFGIKGQNWKKNQINKWIKNKK